MAISTIGTDALASAAVTSAKLASGAPSRSQLPAGTVLQVVQATYSTQVANTTTTPASSGLTASITPTSASSKILVIISDPMRRGNGGVYGINLLLYRNGSNIFNPMTNMFYSNTGSTDLSNMVTLTYLDSPASSSSVTYIMYFASSGGGYPVYSQIDNNTGSIILMEIAA